MRIVREDIVRDALREFESLKIAHLSWKRMRQRRLTLCRILAMKED